MQLIQLSNFRMKHNFQRYTQLDKQNSRRAGAAKLVLLLIVPENKTVTKLVGLLVWMGK